MNSRRLQQACHRCRLMYSSKFATKSPSQQCEVSYICAIQSEDLRTPLVTYLWGHYKPANASEGKRIVAKAHNYRLINDQVYRSNVCGPLLKCISQAGGKDLLPQIHNGMCSSHLGTRKVAGKAFRQVSTGPQQFQMRTK